MKINAVLGSLVAAATASAAAVQRFQTKQASYFNVTDFSASCIPHSVECSYNFTVVADSSKSPPTQCGQLVQGPYFLPAVPLSGCENNVYAWAVATAANGSLGVSVTTSFNSRVNLTGTHYLSKEQLVKERNGAVVTQRYIGPKEFVMRTYGTSNRPYRALY
ncbi:Uu.00g104690.m01.CDS01 [Anthostomella pinea]|uniref:Uu.00g104690.m01.CDS01 n=1 Tax=Anthostomella pinea TaxID=933095 RepID=A0AAI8YFV1_9PEZI|nr:Uu.00g104690.m01.CDS01 [Anthostomella pinea]